LLSRIHAAFSTVSLRRQLREAREKLGEGLIATHCVIYVFSGA
jgi:hypothetical protein